MRVTFLTLERDGMSISRNPNWLGRVKSDEPSPATYRAVCGMELPGGLCGLPAQHEGACRR